MKKGWMILSVISALISGMLIYEGAVLFLRYMDRRMGLLVAVSGAAVAVLFVFCIFESFCKSIWNKSTADEDGMWSPDKDGESITKEIRMEFVRKHKTQTGYINVSSPELTAIDLIENEKSIGGLNRVCTVLNELVDVMNLDSLDDSFFKTSPIPVFQRLGYILDHILEREDLAETLYSKIVTVGLKFRRVPFKINKPTDGCEVDKRWKVIINQKIEIDE